MRRKSAQSSPESAPQPSLSPLEERLADLRPRYKDRAFGALTGYVTGAGFGFSTLSLGGYGLRQALIEHSQGQQITGGYIVAAAISAGVTVLGFGAGVHYDGEARTVQAEILRLESQEILEQPQYPPIPPDAQPIDPNQM